MTPRNTLENYFTRLNGGKRGRLFSEVRENEGFSLLEVLISLSVFAIGSVAVLGLMVVLLRYSKESWQETRSAQIARQIFDDLGSGQKQSGYLVRGTNYSSDVQSIDLTKAGNFTQRYDINGYPVKDGDGSTRFEAKVSLIPDSARENSLCNVEVEVVPNATPMSLFPPDGAATTVSSPIGGSGANSGKGSSLSGPLRFFSKITVPEMEKASASGTTSTAMR